MSGRTFKLFACCIPVRGARRSTVCDLQRRSYHFVPNGLYDILTEYRDRPADEIRAAFSVEDGAVIDEYFEFLAANQLGFWCDDPAAFPDLDLTWEAAAQITNAIIDTGESSRHDYGRILAQLNELGCRALQLRFFRDADCTEVDALLSHTLTGRLRSIELIVKHSPDWNDAAIENLCRRHSRLLTCWVHSAPEARATRVLSDSVPLLYRTQPVTSEIHCGEVSPAYFAISTEAFAEATAHNSCLNRKISVDQYGEIRNCPAMPRSFGNTRDTSLQSAVVKRDFQEVWSINKDQIETCKDCEFRFICTDCRALIRDPNDRYSKPSKCAYDPYAATWA
jgi:SPASM domain peptide maturase of grasp-with-spasm system